MSLVVVNASGPITTTLPLISSVPGGTITIKDSGSASATNTITIVATAGNTFEIGTSYVLNTPLAYATFIGNPITLKWRVLGITNPDTPLFTSTIVNSNTGTIGGATATINTLTVSGIATLGNTSNTGNLGVAGTTTLNTVSATNLNFSGGLYSNGILFTGGSASPNFSTISTIGQAAFYSSMQIQGGLSVFSTITARNINFNGLLTSNGTTIVGSPPGINSAGSIGINSASNASYSLLVTGNQSNTGTLGVAGTAAITGSIITSGLSFSNGNSGATYNFTTFNAGIGYTRMTLTSATNGLGNYYLGINCNAPAEFLDVNGNAKVAGTLVASGGFYGKMGINQWITSSEAAPRARMYFAADGDTYFQTGAGYGFRNRDDAQLCSINSSGGITCTTIRVATLAELWGISSTDNVARIGFFSSGWTAFNVSTGNGYSFRANGAEISYINASGTYVASDIRVKKNIKSATETLDIVNNLNFVSFDYIDSTRNSVKHGLIAQEVEKVYPDMVSIGKAVLPTHLEVVDFDLEASGNIIIKCQSAHGLLVNDEIKLDIDDTFSYKKILEVPSERTFIVSSWDNFSATSSVSIYGKQVKDFLSIDKVQIGLLAARACQTLSGQVSTLQSDSLTQASTITGIQSDSEVKASTITGLQSALDSQQSTITSILSKLST